jgi:hypothetical protein
VPDSVTMDVDNRTTVVGVELAVTVTVGRLSIPSDSVIVSVRIGLPLITVTIRDGEGVEETVDRVADAEMRDAEMEDAEMGDADAEMVEMGDVDMEDAEMVDTEMGDPGAKGD